ncbi:NAD(P)H-binding protein [Lentzea sp. BCCO 10_0061]|uniref:NAD(P)H-binding protein n=1 Tax=Lentzea sokolovensis TaxID=3095429 RepID=A0ABU4V3I3_9PSEU|nr:NAD(P)H-binding protein [Lentzea sp. BCCO 10_0061]MDX8146363.1 NAD(P)H-binding protein [Lentzea sp. BCCO 10_0061]
MTILVTGARGNVGRRVLQRLYAAGHSLRASGRNPAELDVPEGVETVALDLNDPETFVAALAGVSKVLLYAEPDGIVKFLDEAEKAGVEQVVLLSSNTVGLPGADQDPLAHHHLLVEEAVVTSGLNYTVLRPGAFMSNAFGWSYSLQAGDTIDQVFPEAQVAPVHEDDIADVAVIALTEKKLQDEIVDLTGPESLTFRQELEIVGDVLGRKLVINGLTREEGEAQMSNFVPPPVLTSLLNQWEAAVGVVADTSATAERITGKPARTFRQWVEEHASFLV